MNELEACEKNPQWPISAYYQSIRLEVLRKPMKGFSLVVCCSIRESNIACYTLAT